MTIEDDRSHDSASSDGVSSPCTSHSDSSGPPLSDLPALSDDRSDWTPSERSDEDEAEEAFDMVASADWSAQGSGKSSTTGDEHDRMRLSFPDPMMAQDDSSAPPSDLGASFTGDAGYSFLLDASSNPVSHPSTPPEATLASSVVDSLDTSSQPTQDLPRRDSTTSTQLDNINNPPSPSSVRPAPASLKTKSRDITTWVKLTGEARGSTPEGERDDVVEQEDKEAAESIVDTTNSSFLTDPSVETEDLIVEPLRGELKIAFIGGTSAEQELIVDRLALVPELDAVELSVISTSTLEGGSTALVVHLVERGGKVDAPAVEEVFTRVGKSIKVLPVVYSSDGKSSPSTSTASIDSQATVKAPMAEAIVALRSIARQVQSLSVPATSFFNLQQSRSRSSTLRLSSLAPLVTMEDVTDATDSSLVDELRGLVVPSPTHPVPGNFTSFSTVHTLDVHQKGAIHARLEELGSSARKSVVSKTLLLLTAALAIVAASLLETSPSFAALRSAGNASDIAHHHHHHQQATSSTINPVASTSTLPSSVPSLPPAESRAGIAASSQVPCSITSPGACALALVDSPNSLAVIANRFASRPSLFGNTSDDSERRPSTGRADKKPGGGCSSKRKTAVVVVEKEEDSKQGRRVVVTKSGVKRLRPRTTTSEHPFRTRKTEKKRNRRRPGSTRLPPPTFRDAIDTIAGAARSKSKQYFTHIDRSTKELARRAEEWGRRAAVEQRQHLTQARTSVDALTRRARVELDRARVGFEEVKEVGVKVFVVAETHVKRAVWVLESVHQGEVGWSAEEGVVVKACEGDEGCLERRERIKALHEVDASLGLSLGRFDASMILNTCRRFFELELEALAQAVANTRHCLRIDEIFSQVNALFVGAQHRLGLVRVEDNGTRAEEVESS